MRLPRQPTTHCVLTLLLFDTHLPLPPVLPLLVLHHTHIEWVQDTAAATDKWGDIGDWDVSGVKDFSLAFSKQRDEGGSFVSNGNLKAATFVGTAISKWKTTALTSLENTFRDAGAMNSDLSGWSVVKVTTMESAFYGASKFTGGGLNLWETTALTNLNAAFDSAGEMNNDLGGWSVAKVTSMVYTFKRASKFIGMGLGSWDTASVKSLRETFRSAKAFVGTGLSSWDTTSVTSLAETFKFAIKFNTDLHSFDVSGTAVMTGGVAAREPRGGAGC